MKLYFRFKILVVLFEKFWFVLAVKVSKNFIVFSGLEMFFCVQLHIADPLATTNNQGSRKLLNPNIATQEKIRVNKSKGANLPDESCFKKSSI